MQMEELTSIIPAEFADNARVWIYQSSRPFIDKEVNEINEQLHQFYAHWQSHGDPVKGWAKLLYKQFIIVIADENDVQVSGCSTDGSVRIVKSIERQYSVNFFDRMMITFLVNGKAEMLPLNQVQYAIERGYINKDTPLFNNTIGLKKELFSDWLIPLHSSWLASRVSLNRDL